MKRLTTILLAVVLGTMLVSWAQAKDTGNRDVLRLSDAVYANGEWKVAVHVINDEQLAALDIPLRFAQPNENIDLVRVDFAQRVADWDFTHAQIDNQAKTVILGLISELVNMRPNADMKVSASGDTKIADLVFKVAEGQKPSFSTFTTQSPGHELTYIYNENVEGTLQVQSVQPEFEANVSFKDGGEQLPTEYALSQNFPNPFNPSTSFALSLPEASDFSIRIFNITGQMVKAYSGHLEAGVHNIVWDGRNEQGSSVASGVYFYKAEAGAFNETRKMMMLK
jgi:flagellar hook capping protein FlgD